MILDRLLTFSTAQAVTVSAASTDAVDLTKANDYGLGESLQVAFVVTTAVAAAGAATVTFSLEQADDGAFGTNLETVATSGAVPKALLTLGAVIPLKWNSMRPRNARRHIRAYYTVATGPLTAGAFTAAVVKDVQTAPVNFPSGLNF